MNGAIGPESKHVTMTQGGTKMAKCLFLAAGYTSFWFCRIEAFAILGYPWRVFMNGPNLGNGNFWMGPHSDRSWNWPIKGWTPHWSLPLRMTSKSTRWSHISCQNAASDHVYFTYLEFFFLLICSSPQPSLAKGDKFLGVWAENESKITPKKRKS